MSETSSVPMPPPTRPTETMQVAQLAERQGRAPDPTYKWTTVRQTPNGEIKTTFAFNDLYAVDDPDDLTAPYELASSLFLYCVESDHLEYMTLPGTSRLIFGQNSPHITTPRQLAIAVRTGGRIGAADSVAISKYLLAALDDIRKWNANGELNYVGVLVDDKIAYLSLTNFATARQEVLSACVGKQTEKQVSVLTASLDQFCTFLDQSNRRVCACQRDVIMRNAKTEYDVIGAIAYVKNRADLAGQLSRRLGGGIMAQSTRTLFWQQIALAASGCGR